MRKKLLNLSAVFILFLSCPLSAQNLSFPSLEPLFIEEKTSAELSPLEIIQDGLRFSECAENSEEWNSCVQKFLSLEHKILAAVKNLSASEAAEKILFALYEDLLVQYCDQQTKINVAFTNGTYNCVSSSVIYYALAKSAGIDVAGVKTPTHAFCSLRADGKRIDVETTNPYGFNPGQTRVLEKTENSERYAVIPKKNYANRFDVSAKTLVSLVGANMVSFYVSQRNYEKSVPMAAAVMAFRTGEKEREILDAREVFDVPALNFSVELERSGDFRSSILWLEKITSRYGADSKTQNALNAAFHNAAVDFLDKKDFDSAWEIYETHKNSVSEKVSLETQKMIFLSEVQENLDSFSNSDALDYVRSQYSSALATEKSVKSALDKWQEYYWLSLVNEKSAQKNYLEAAALADEGLKAMPGNSNISRAKNIALRNHDVEFHNSAAAYVNSRQYEKAMEILEKGLSENPASRMLQNDKIRLEKILGN